MTEKKLTKKGSKGLETRKRIYDTAMKMFLERGYANVSVNEIINEVNLSKGGFYRHFKSKMDILYEVFSKLDEMYLEYYEDNLKDSDKDYKTRIKEFCVEVLRLNIEFIPQDFLSEVLSFSLISDFGVTNILDENRPYYKIMEAIINEGKETGELRDSIETKVIIRWISAIHRGALYNYCINEKAFDCMEFADEFFGMLTMRIAEK